MLFWCMHLLLILGIIFGFLRLCFISSIFCCVVAFTSSAFCEIVCAMSCVFCLFRVSFVFVLFFAFLLFQHLLLHYLLHQLLLPESLADLPAHLMYLP